MARDRSTPHVEHLASLVNDLGSAALYKVHARAVIAGIEDVVARDADAWLQLGDERRVKVAWATAEDLDLRASRAVERSPSETAPQSTRHQASRAVEL